MSTNGKPKMNTPPSDAELTPDQQDECCGLKALAEKAGQQAERGERSVEYGDFPNNVSDAARAILMDMKWYDHESLAGDVAKARIAALGAMISFTAIRDLGVGPSNAVFITRTAF